MLTLEKCTKVLNKGKRKYTNDEVKLIREYLYFIASLQLELDK